MTTGLGRFAWHDLITSDVDGAVAFYKEVLGWDVRPFEGGGKPYLMWVTPAGKPVGGVAELAGTAKDAGAPPQWFAHVTTPDLSETVATALTMGAKVHMGPMTIPTVGAVTVMADTDGAVFAAFQPEGEAPGHDGKPELGEFGWHELMHAEPEAAWTFYSTLFGWVKRGSMDMGAMGTYQMFGLPHTDSHFGAMMGKPGDAPFGSWVHYTRVVDVLATIAKVQELGGTLSMGPHEVPGDDIIAIFEDPQGAAFAVFGSKAAI